MHFNVDNRDKSGREKFDAPAFPELLRRGRLFDIIARMDNKNSTSQADDTTVTFKRTHLYAVLLPLAFVLGLSMGFIFWGRGATNSPTRTAATGNSPAGAVSVTPAAGTDTGPQEVKRYDIPVDDDPSLGPETAGITIIEFSDFECPYCTKWQTEVWPLIQQTYPDDVRLVYRDFPLTSIHSNAAPAAEAANCAGEQDVYWEYHDLLFKAQYGLGEEAFNKYASDLKLDAAAFSDCLSSRRYQEEVEADFNFASNLGIRSTPTFFINGIAIVGAQPFDVFQEVIELELAGKLNN